MEGKMDTLCHRHATATLLINMGFSDLQAHIVNVKRGRKIKNGDYCCNKSSLN